MATPYISMAGIGKSFGPVHALKSVNLTVYPGEIHALLGENGAGKSTLMKVLSGIHEPTKGTITINNINYNKLDHKLAAQLGIGIIYQELSVIDELTVLENLYIGRHLTKKICGVNIIDWREMRVRAAMMLLRVGLKVDLDEKVAHFLCGDWRVDHRHHQQRSEYFAGTNLLPTGGDGRINYRGCRP